MKLFITDLSNITDDLKKHFESLLSSADKSRYNRIQNPLRRLQFLTGRALISENCGESPTLSETGKPFVSRGYISLSHSGPFVALAISDAPVGLDLEDSSRIRPFQALSNRLHFQMETPVDFYKHFTRYEADYKLGEQNTRIYHFYYSINTFIMCISLLNDKENIEFINSIPYTKNIPLSLRKLS